MSLEEASQEGRDWNKTENLWRKLVDDQGFILIRLKPGSKSPMEEAWGMKVHHKQFEEIGLQKEMNAGVVCGKESGIIVLDIDKPEEFHKLNLDVPETFTVRTGKGTHHYYRLPESTAKYRNRKKGSYDIRAEMGYVVAPGSVHPDGTLYTVIKDIDLVDAPEWLLEESKEKSSEVRRSIKKLDELEEVDIVSLGLPQGIVELIREGPPKDSDRSAKDFIVIKELLKVDCSEEQIAWIYSEYPIGEKADEHQDKKHYLERTIEAAYSAIEEEIQESEWSTVEIPTIESLDADYQILVKEATKDLVRTLEKHENIVSVEKERSLKSLITTYAAMASGKLQGRIAFPLPTGYGKTTSVVSFLSVASKMGLLGKEGFTIAITAFKVEELCDINKMLLKAGVPSKEISLLHSYKYVEGGKYDKYGKPDPNYASMPATEDTSRPILLLTQNKVKNANSFSFADLIEDRSMVIWDESLLTTDVGTSNTTYLRTALAALEGIVFELKVASTDKDLLDRADETHKHLQKCFDMVEDEIVRQSQGNQKEILMFDSLLVGDTIDTLNLLKEKHADQKDYLKALIEFTRITQHDACVQLGDDKGHTLVRFDIVIPDSASNIVILDASAWINELMRLDDTISIPEGLNTNLSYEGTTIHRIPFNSGREAIETELHENEYNLLDVIEDILRKHPKESVLFFTFKQRNPRDTDCRTLMEDHLKAQGHDLKSTVRGKPRFNWLTHGNYTASNNFAHCTVMIFVGMLHLPSGEYDAKDIAQQRNLQGTPDKNKIKHSMHATDGHQGINRGACRVHDGDTAYPVNAYYTYLDDSLGDNLKLVMPGAKFVEYDTHGLLVPRTRKDAAINALKSYLNSLQDVTKISKAKVNRYLPEMQDIKETYRKVVMKKVNVDPTVPWITEGRSWVRI